MAENLYGRVRVGVTDRENLFLQHCCEIAIVIGLISWPSLMSFLYPIFYSQIR